MFESNNSKSLSQLWPDFDKRFLPLCKQRALDCMEADRYSSFIVFGTALDLCEDVFLRSFDRFQLSLVLPDRSNVIVKPVLSDTCARLLVKLTAFESACVSERPEVSDVGAYGSI